MSADDDDKIKAEAQKGEAVQPEAANGRHDRDVSAAPDRSIRELIERERIRGASRMIAEGTDPTSVTEDQIACVRADASAFMASYAVKANMVAKSIGYTGGVISEFIAGKYKGSNAQVAMDLDRWLDEEEKRRQRPQTTQFVWTEVARTIEMAAQYALQQRKIALVYGPETSGIGKTMALTAIYQTLGPRRSSLITIDKVDASPTGVLKKICAALRIGNIGKNVTRVAAIVEKLHGRSHILLIDQVQNLRFSRGDLPFYVLADLYDALKDSGGAQLWCGTADLDAYLQKQRVRSADESLAQIRSRIFPRIDLMEQFREGGGAGAGEPLVTVDQIREMFARNKLKLTGAAARFLCQLANLPDSGSLRLCGQIVEYATTLAEMRKLTSIDTPLLQEALRMGFTPRGASLLNDRLNDRAQPRIARSA